MVVVAAVLTGPSCCEQVQALQKEHGANTEGSEPVKPLAHILMEAKQAKDEAFQNQWKQMKQGDLHLQLWALSPLTS